MSDEQTKEIDPLTRAAILIMSLSKDESVSVLKHLGPKQVQKLGIAMAALQNIDKSQRDKAVNCFLIDAQEQTSIGVDSDDYIRSVLTNALGAEKAEGMLDRILQAGNTKGLDNLKWMDSRAVAEIIKLEHPQIQSIVLSYVDPDQAAEILAYFDEKTRLDLILRISALEGIQPAAIQELNSVLEKQFSGKSTGSTRAVGGLKTAAEMLNFLDSSLEAQLMQDLKERDAELGQSIQDLMFVFDNLIDVDDRGIQTLLREVSSDVLILALKGAEESFREKVFKNMSKRASELLRDDLEAKGPVKVSEVETAQKEILTIARKLADAGELSLGGKGGEEMI